MILRKPYAFLIKRFKLIHIIMSFIMVYLVFKTNNAVEYFNEYINSNVLLREPASNYFNTIMFMVVILIIGFSVLVHYLLRYKKKPRLIYLITIIGYFASLIIFYNSFSVLKELETVMLDARTVRLWRDLLAISQFYQYIIIIIMLVRGMGFDIKRFNFKTDLKELEIEEKDNEEFEFVLGDSKELILKKTRKTIRKLKYFTIENKFILTIILGMGLSLFIVVLLINIFITNKIYKEKDNIITNTYTMSIESSYYTSLTSNRKYILNKDDVFLILNLKIKSLYNYSYTLTPTDFRVIIDGVKYFPTVKYCNKVTDLGTCYYKQDIDINGGNYILMYKVPKEVIGKEAILYYEDDVRVTNVGIDVKYKKVKLNVVNIDEISENKDVSVNTMININNVFIRNTNINIMGYEVGDRFFHRQNICDKNNICETETSVIVVDNITTKNKTILKLNLNYDGSLSMKKFIDRYISIKYKINDIIYNSSISNKTPDNASGNAYIEVDRNVAIAQEVYLQINSRNYNYVYRLK